MAFTIYLHREQFQPEEPQILDSHVRKDTLFTFVDFIPSIIKRSSTSIITAAEIEYHSFRDMVGTANEWLERNDHLEVVNCETIRVLYKFNDCGNYYELRPNVVSHYVYGSEKNNILKVLRLWMRKRTEIGTNLQDSPGTQGSVTTFATAVHTSTVETGRAAQFVALAANSSASSVLGDAGYESVRSGSILHRSLIATESNDSTNSEPANFTSVLSREIKSDSFDSPTNESVPIAPTNLTAAKQQHHFRLQQQNSQQQFQLQSGTNAPPPSGATNAGTNVTSSGNVGNASGTNVTATVTMSTNTATTTNRLNRQQSLHRQLSFQQQLSPKLRNKSKMAKAAPKFDLLDYVDIVPECNESRSKDSPTGGPSSLAKSDKFERLDDCVRRLNSMLTTGRIRGQLLCVETIAAEASIDWKVYPEKNFTEFSSKTILFLRCYFRPDLEVETPQQVGIIDFIPCHLSGGGFFKRPKFENFTQVLARSTQWLAEHPQCIYKNAQSLDIKLKSQFSPSAVQLVDSRQMWFTEHGDYLKIYRVIYTISTSDLLRTAEQTLRGAGTSMLPVRRTEILKRTRISSVDSTHVESLANSAMLLSMRNAPSRQPRPSTAEMSLFNAETSDRPMSMPAQPSTSGSLSKTNLWIANQFGRPIYLSSKIFVAQKTTQTISDLRESIQDWYNALEKEYRELNEQPGMRGLQRTRILSAETMQVFAKQEPGKGGELANLQRLGEQPFMYNRFGAKNGYLISVFRVYFDIGWFAWERLGYARGHRQKRSLLRRLNAIAARPPPDLNLQPVVTQQQPSGSAADSLLGVPDDDDSRPVSSNMSVITLMGSDLESVLPDRQKSFESSQDRRTSEDTGVETLLDDDIDYDSDGEPTTTIRSVSELHGSDDPSEALDSESCLVLTGGLSNLSLLGSESEATIHSPGSVSRHSSMRRTLHRNSSVGSSASGATSNCSLM